MKRIADYLVLALCITLWGCEELPVVPPGELPVENKMVTITATAGDNGTIEPSGVSEIKLGNSMIYFIKPDTNYDIMSIKVDGVEQPIDDTFEFKNVLFNRNINVEFVYVKPQPIVKKFTIEVISGPNGTISPSGKFEVDSGTVITFTLQPNVGFKVDSISINDIKLPLIDSVYTVTVTSNNTINADFQKTALGMLIQKPWKTIISQERPVGTPVWYDFIGESAVLTGTYSFDSSFRFEYLNNENIVTGDGYYILKQDSLIIGSNPQGDYGMRSKIILLTDDSLRITLISKCYGEGYCPDYEIQCTYIH